MKKTMSILLVAMSMVVAGTAYGGIRCPSGGGSCVVSEGADKSELYSCCGSPDMQSSNVRVIKDGNARESVNVDTFTYNCGERRFMYKVTMENDKIISIQNAGRADFSAYEKDSQKLSRMLLDKVRVVTVPGREFGMEGHLRLSYAGTVKDVTEGVARMKWALDPNSANELFLGGRKLVRDWS